MRDEHSLSLGCGESRLGLKEEWERRGKRRAD